MATIHTKDSLKPDSRSIALAVGRMHPEMSFDRFLAAVSRWQAARPALLG